jgi:hypothetical protein
MGELHPAPRFLASMSFECISGVTLNYTFLAVFQAKFDLPAAREADAQDQLQNLLLLLGPEKLQAWLQQASDPALKQVQSTMA